MDTQKTITCIEPNYDDQGKLANIVNSLKALVSATWPRNTLLNIYLHGSRLFGVQKPTSDYDFWGICSGEYFYSYRPIDSLVTTESGYRTEKIEVNLNLIHLTYFQETLKGAFINSIMLCFLPPKFVFLETVPIRDDFKLDLPNIRLSVQMDATQVYAKAKRLWRTGDFYTAKKNIVHGLRYLLYSLQLLGPKGCIYDFQAGNEYWSEVMALTEPSKDDPEMNSKLWQVVEARFSPIYKELTDKMKEYCSIVSDAAKAWEWRWLTRFYGEDSKLCLPQAFRYSVIPPQILIDYIKEYGIEEVSRRFGVRCTRHRKHRHLISLSRTQMAAVEFMLVQWCSGIILDESQNFSIVALPFSKIFGSTSDFDLQSAIDWHSEIVVESLHDGQLGIVYFYEGEWHVGSAESPDGAEQIGWVSPIKLPDWKNYVVEGFNFNPVHEANMLVDLHGNGTPNPSFAEHFWLTFQESGLELSQLDKSKIWLFELESPWMVHIVEHKERKITLVGVRDRDSGRELDPHTVANEMQLDPKFLVKRWILAGNGDTNLPMIQENQKQTSTQVNDPLREFMSSSVKVQQTADLGLESESRGNLNASREQGSSLSAKKSESAIFPPPTLLDAIQSTLRYFDPTEISGLMVKTSDGRRVAFRSPQFLSLDRLHPLSDSGLVDKHLLELARSLCPRTWIELPKYSHWIEKYRIVEHTYKSLVIYMQSIWNEAKILVKQGGRSAAVPLLSKHPIISGELFLLIKRNLLDTTSAEHLSGIPFKRLQVLLKKIAEQNKRKS